MNDETIYFSWLLNEAGELFAAARDDPDSDEKLAELITWLRQSDDHLAVCKALAGDWIGELLELVAAFPDEPEATLH